ncbi:MAG: hypothetical protein AAB449_03265 [Patescibacteria group bacterium]
MELKDFITKVLSDIVNGVEAANRDAIREIKLDSSKGDRTVEFDIAVTAEDTLTTEGQAKVEVLSLISGGGGVEKEVKNSSVSRIKFGVYVSGMTKNEHNIIRTKQFRDAPERGNPGF